MLRPSKRSSAFPPLLRLLLLALLALGIRGIRLGPTLPAFLSPGVAAALQQKYDLKPITTPEADLAACLGSHAAD